MTTLDRDSKGRFISGVDAASGKSVAAKVGLAATAGVALGMIALLGRKTAVQASSILAGDWPEALAADHLTIMAIIDDLQATQTRAVTKRTMLLAHLKHTLQRHMLEEENVIYPVLREHGEREAVARLIADHGDVRHQLYRLDTMPKNAPDFRETVAACRATLEEHMAEEERLFPTVFAVLDEAGNRVVTRAMNREGFKLA